MINVSNAKDMKLCVQAVQFHNGSYRLQHQHRASISSTTNNSSISKTSVLSIIVAAVVVQLAVVVKVIAAV